MSLWPRVEADRFHLGPGGVVVVTGGPDRRSMWRIRARDKVKLVVNRQLGYTGDDVSFLRHVGDRVEALEVVGSFVDDSGIEACTGLRELNLNTDVTRPVNWSALPQLQDVLTYAGRLTDGIKALDGLRRVHLHRATDDDVRLLCDLPSLRDLRLSSARVRHCGWRFASPLGRLDIRMARSLADFSALEHMGSLQRLDLTSCNRMTDIGFLGGLPGLRHLSLIDDGTIASLRPLASLRDLRFLSFAGTTNVADGDLAVLGQLPALEQAMYRNRRHYRGGPQHFPTRD